MNVSTRPTLRVTATLAAALATLALGASSASAAGCVTACNTDIGSSLKVMGDGSDDLIGVGTTTPPGGGESASMVAVTRRNP